MTRHVRATGLTTLQDALAAADRLSGLIVRTPLLPSAELSSVLGCRVLVKAENVQHTGSFKVRGALNALLSRRERGELVERVVTFSAGNHGIAVASAARRLGLHATVCMNPGAVRNKIDAVLAQGAEVVLDDNPVTTATEMAERTGDVLLHPFDDPDVIAGQATVGLEIAEQAPTADLVVVPVGGGGLISGVAAVLHALLPATRIAGAEPVDARTLGHAVDIGAACSLPLPPRSLADGLAAPFAGLLTYQHVRHFVHHLVAVTEDDLARAWPRMVMATRLLVEASAAVALAAAESGALPIPVGGTLVLVATGGNADLNALSRAVA